MENIKKNILIVAATMLLPYIITLLFVNNNLEEYVRYEIPKSGKSIILDKSEIDLEEFIPLVLTAGMDGNEKEELLKVQAVIIRTYIVNKMQEAEVDRISADTLEINYTSYEKLMEEYDYLKKIVADTSGEIITYDGKTIIPYVHQASCGKTREGDMAYLKSVDSSDDIQVKNYLSIKYFDRKDFVNIIREKYEKIEISEKSVPEDISITNEDGSEYVKTVLVGKEKISGDDFAKLFDIPSPCFTIEEYEGQIRVISKGIGHGYGISMYGANIMAENGKTYDEIIKYYFSGTHIEQSE